MTILALLSSRDYAYASSGTRDYMGSSSGAFTTSSSTYGKEYGACLWYSSLHYRMSAVAKKYCFVVGRPVRGEYAG